MRWPARRRIASGSKTLAERKFDDDVPEEVKGAEVAGGRIAHQMIHARGERTQALVGKVHRVD